MANDLVKQLSVELPWDALPSDMKALRDAQLARAAWRLVDDAFPEGSENLPEGKALRIWAVKKAAQLGAAGIERPKEDV